MEISVVVATYNQLEYLPKVMGAWNKQTFKDYSLYLVDDGSTDGTKEWAKKNAKKLNFKLVNMLCLQWLIAFQLPLIWRK